MLGNMSYCRFRNTLRDLRDCADHIEDGDLSQDEQKAREQLIALCKNIGACYGEDGE